MTAVFLLIVDVINTLRCEMNIDKYLMDIYTSFFKIRAPWLEEIVEQSEKKLANRTHCRVNVKSYLF